MAWTAREVRTRAVRLELATAFLNDASGEREGARVHWMQNILR